MSDLANAPVTIEIVVDSTAGAIAAAEGGADRIELCQSLGEGGLTPSAGLCAAVSAAVALPVFAMVRPRAGDFLYDDGDFDVMRRDIDSLRQAGARGIVTGILTADGHIDRERMAELVRVAADLPVTCHRAFDLCADASEAIDTLCELGVARVLTSGQAASAPQGHGAIRAVVQHANDRLEVMAGAGVHEDNVADLVAATGVREVHLSATTWRDSGMTFRRTGVSMGSAPPQDEYAVRTTDPKQIARVVSALRNDGSGATMRA